MKPISKVPSVYSPQAECCSCGKAAPGSGKKVYAERKRSKSDWYDYLCSICLTIFTKLNMNYNTTGKPIPRNGWKVRKIEDSD